MLNAYRRSVLGLASLPPLERFARRHGYRLAARRFVAGETPEQALPALHALRAEGKRVIVDVLGEYVRDEATARAMAADVATTIEVLARAGFAPVVSVKPTQLGLAIDTALAEERTLALALDAEAAGGKLAIDMEDSRFVDATLDLLRRVWAGGARRTSTVLQAYLKRTPDDLDALLRDAPEPSAFEVRIVKGAYAEPESLVHRDLGAIRAAFTELCERAWRAGASVNVATHDERLLVEATAFARGAQLPPERLELQLLYGVKPALQRSLVDAGHGVRIYVPVGREWYGYFSRRIAERPANLGVVLRGLVG